MDEPALAPVAGGRRISTALAVAVCALAFLTALAVLARPVWPETVMALMALATELPVAGAIFLAAGGWGRLALRPLLPKDTPTGLAALTSVAVGLWLLGTAMLVVGSALPGALTGALWWPAVLAGIALALWFARGRLASSRAAPRVSPAALAGVLLGAAAGIWLAGATVPQGLIGRSTGDFYDVVSYHLQVPREFYLAGRIGFLRHNTYGNYPLGGEMLFLLAMVLRGGPWAGAQAATLTHGLWGVLAVAALWSALPGGPWRRRTAALLLAGAPVALFLSWLAFVELSELAYLALGIAWLGRWHDRPAARQAALVGLMCGGACATKYLSVGLVAGPLLLVMFSLRPAGGRRAAQTALAGLLCLLLMAPWLIRNVVHTGNPVFPLATGLLGRGHWTPEVSRRWDAGHAAPAWRDKPAHLVAVALDARGLGAGLLLPAGLWAALTLARRRRADVLDRACLGVVALQVLVWSLATHMPSRFLAPAAVPLAILAGGLIARLAGGERAGRRAGLAVAVVLAGAGVNLAQAGYVYRAEPLAIGHGLRPDDITSATWNPALREELLRPGARLLQVGDVRPFNFPAGTLYATVWEPDPLVELARQGLEPRDILRRLRSDYGVTHIWIHWGEIRRVGATYGWWEEITPALVEALIFAGAHPVELGGPEGTQPRLSDGRAMVQLLRLPALDADDS